MANFVTDTHALIWSLRHTSLLGFQAGQIFEACQRGELVVAIPTICLVEIIYLEEKGRIPPGLLTHLYTVLQSKTTNWHWNLSPPASPRLCAKSPALRCPICRTASSRRRRCTWACR